MDINLLPWRLLQVKEQQHQQRLRFSIIAIIFFLIGASLHLILMMQLDHLQYAVKKESDRYGKTLPAYHEVKALYLDIKNYSAMLLLLKKLQIEQTISKKILNFLGHLPSEISLSEVRKVNHQIKLLGKTNQCDRITVLPHDFLKNIHCQLHSTDVTDHSTMMQFEFQAIENAIQS